MRFIALTCTIVFWTFIDLDAQRTDFGDVNFAKADCVANLFPHHSLANLKLLSQKLTHSLPTEVEKFRAIYRWICNNIDNDYHAFLKNKYKRDKLVNRPDELKVWEKKFSTLTFKKLYSEHKTVCTGYAYLLKELAGLSGLTCITINGYGRTFGSNIGGPGIPNHTWNAILLGDKWYLCDPTWSSGNINAQDGTFLKNFNDSYFLAEPRIFVLNHYPFELSQAMTSNTPTLAQFLNRPLIYSPVYRHGIDSIAPENFNILAIKGKAVTFRIGSTTNGLASSRVELLVFGPGKNSISGKIQSDSTGGYTIDHTFTSAGIYTAHILIDQSYAVSYSVKVERAR